MLLLATMFLGLVSSCSDDDNTGSGNSGGTHKVVFKAVASEGSNVTFTIYSVGNQSTSASSLSGTTWSSPEITIPAGTQTVYFTASADGASASSTLKAQIYVDGELKAEGTSSGKYLSADTLYDF